MARIVLVHDHPTIRHAVRSYLERCDHTVTTASKARLALDLVDRETDVVVTDIEMPAMGGMGFIQSLRERNIFTPVVLMSERFPHAEEAAAAGYVLLKPFAPDQLVHAIDAVLGRIPAAREAVAG